MLLSTFPFFQSFEAVSEQSGETKQSAQSVSVLFLAVLLLAAAAMRF
jgi:hypothetical protein